MLEKWHPGPRTWDPGPIRGTWDPSPRTWTQDPICGILLYRNQSIDLQGLVFI